MITLSSEYQYIGRSSAVKAYGSPYNYYVLLYAKTVGSEVTGEHKVSVKMRLACDRDATFYGFATSGSVVVAGTSAISWNGQSIPAAYWGDSPSLAEDGQYYYRYVDLKEGTVVVSTDFGETEIDISATWQRLDINTTPPNWLPSTTKAEAAFSVLLPAIVPAEPIPPDEENVIPPEDEEPENPVTFIGTRVYADGVLAYDSMLEDYDLDGLKATHGLNIGGTAEIIMPRDHPAYNLFVGHRTIVTIYRDNKLRFRGRALYSADTVYGRRTITCEGELCLLRDGINRPYSYKSTPAKIFRALVRKYNEQVESWKQFTIGTVTVTDPNDYISMESESAETILDTLNKLVERCGGYIVFTSLADGSRVIHWLANLDRRSAQSIEFGENLLDFSSTGANTTTLATGLVPYGARNEETKKRLTVESVNGGKDYIIAEDARAVRGTIMATATWDDVTEPANLLKKARAYLEEKKVFITSMELTALDLSYMDKEIDSFSVGDMIRVTSAPHGVDEDFQLTQLTEDLLHPANSQVTLGKDVHSLTREDVAGDHRGQNAVEAMKVSYSTDIEKVTSTVGAAVMEQAAQVYIPRAEMDDYAKQADLEAEVSARAGILNKVDGVVHIGGGAPINILGGKIDINGSEINFGKEIRFPNGLGIRIADKDGNYYYVIRVDTSNSFVVGNDYTNLYLRGKDAVYLYKTGAVVTSDQREKNSIEELPDAYLDMLSKLTPRRFRYNGRGDRYHVGFVAQEVEAAMTSAGLEPEDFGGFVDLNGDGSTLGLAYDEFTGLLLEKLHRLEKRIETLEGKK